MYNGNELDLKDLDMVNGGINLEGNKNAQTAISYCKNCKKDTKFYVFKGGRGRCSVCNEEKFI
jgi:hypothetical protein